MSDFEKEKNNVSSTSHRVKTLISIIFVTVISATIGVAVTYATGTGGLRIMGQGILDSASTPVVSIDTNTRQLVSSGGTTTLSWANGNVGIGTTTSSAKFHVIGNMFIGDGSATTYRSVYNAITGDKIRFYGDDTSYALGVDAPGILYYNASGNHSFRIGTAEKVRITSDGNVGIGTTTPGYPLTVAGDVNFTGTLRQNGTAFGSSQWISTTSSAIYYSAGNVGIGTAAPGSALTVKSAIEVRESDDGFTAANLNGASTYGYLDLYSSGAVGTRIMGGSGNSYFNGGGNVGIGTTTPGALLHVHAPAQQAFKAYRGNGGTIAQFVGGGYGTTLSIGDTLGSISLLTSSWALGFSGQGRTTADMVLSNTGNVGIGTTTPMAKLSLLTSPSSTPGTGNGLHIVRDNGNGWEFQLGTAEGLMFNKYYGGSWQNAMVISRDTGNVGIGTTSPTRLLTVNGNAQFGDTVSTATANPLNVSFGGTYGNNTPGTVGNLKWDMFTNGSTGNRYGIGMSSNLMEYQAGASGQHAFFVNRGTEAMRILANGNVGIGTTSPVTKLQMDGNGVVFAIGPNAGAVMPGLSRETTQGGLSIDKYTSAGVFSANLMTLLGGGNVGIGTTAPSAQLDINRTYNAATDWTSGVSNAQTLSNTTADGRSFIGMYNNVHTVGSTKTLSTVYGQRNYVYPNSAYAISTAYGQDNYVAMQSGNSGTVSNAIAALNRIDNAGSGIVTTAIGNKITVANSGAGTTVNAYGLYLDAVTSGTTLNYSIYSAGGTNYFAGNVGIGTTAPDGKLDIYGAPLDVNRGSVRVMDTTSFATNVGGYLTLGGKYNTAGGYADFAGIKGAKEVASDGQISGYLALSTRVTDGNMSEKVRITSTGNVGIGTTTPGARLSIVPNSTAPDTALLIRQSYVADASWQKLLDIQNKDGVSQFIVRSRGSDGATGIETSGAFMTNSSNDIYGFRPLSSGSGAQSIQAKALLLSASYGDISSLNAGTIYGGFGSAENLTLQSTLSGTKGFVLINPSGGNVGIGTSTPSAKLDVYGTAGSADIFAISSSTNSRLFTVGASGNVGIGTAAPSSNLHVVGTTYISSNLRADGYVQVGSAGYVIEGISGGLQVNGNWNVQGIGSSAIAGKLGIGTTTPGNVLTVATGSIRVSEKVLAAAGSMTINWREGNQQLVRISTTGITMTFSNYEAGQNLKLVVCNPDAGTPGTITWPGTIAWSGGSAPSQTLTNSKCDIWSFIATMGTSTLNIFGAQSPEF